MSEINRLCPSCGAPLVKRRQRATGHEFLGCSRWAPGAPDHCDHTEALPEWFRLREQGAPTLPGFDEP